MDTIGTNNFESHDAACRYYATYGLCASDVDAKISNSEIVIGRPEIPKGHAIYVNDDGRYGLCETGLKFTARDYMSGACSHDEYFEQFVTPYLRATVAKRIGAARIKKSTDEHFNDIPLKEWDSLANQIVDWSLLALAEGTTYAAARIRPLRVISLAAKVCTLKAAARLIKAEK